MSASLLVSLLLEWTSVTACAHVYSCRDIAWSTNQAWLQSLEMFLCACSIFCAHVACEITTSLFISCLTLSEEFLCHTIHAASCWPQVSHIEQLHWLTDRQAVSLDLFCVSLKWHKIFGALYCHVAPWSPDLSADYWLTFPSWVPTQCFVANEMPCSRKQMLAAQTS